MIRKCVITRYDESITEAPFITIPIDSVEVSEPLTDNLGEEFALRIFSACRSKGYNFKFYTTSRNKDFDYEIVVE